MKLEIPSENLITKQNILMVLYLLNKFNLKLKYLLVHLLLTPNSAFCSYTLLSAPGTMQITFLFSHLATFCALKIEHARGRLHVRKGEKDSFLFALLGFPSASCTCVTITTAKTARVPSYGMS